MKALSKKRFYFASVIIAFLIPVAIYFYILKAHDVNILQSEYPWVKEVDKGEVVVTFQKKKPPYWVSLKEISTFGRWAIVLSEDWSFYQHQGVDVEQMKVAIEEMWKESRFRGASTITQQMIKNVFLTEDRTLWRKVNEYALTAEAEKTLSKNKILEIYLNSIEFGPSIYGIKAAARHYFGKHPSMLSPRESAFIAMLLPSPKRYYVSFKRKRLTTFARNRVKSVLEKLRMAKVITKERYFQELNSRFSWESD